MPQPTDVYLSLLFACLLPPGTWHFETETESETDTETETETPTTLTPNES